MATQPTEMEMRLWNQAKRRAEFKKHLILYIIIIGFLWAIWFLTGSPIGGGAPWPVWPALGWGLFLAFNYFAAFHGSVDELTHEEYEKLLRQKGLE